MALQQRHGFLLWLIKMLGKNCFIRAVQCLSQAFSRAEAHMNKRGIYPL